MAKEIINLPGVTSRPYSQAVRTGNFIYCSGTGGQVDRARIRVPALLVRQRQTRYSQRHNQRQDSKILHAMVSI